MPIDYQTIAHNEKIIAKLIKAYVDFTDASHSAYDDLARLLLPEPSHGLDRQRNKFLTPIAAYLIEDDYQAFTQAQILAKLAKKYPVAKLEAKSSIAQILAWSQQNKSRAGYRIKSFRDLFAEFTAEQWQALAETLRIADIQSLDLSDNDLNNFTPEQWQTLGNLIKDTYAQVLDLTRNTLHLLTVTLWLLAGEALKTAGIQTLILSWNSLNLLSDEQWLALGNFLKIAGIHTLNLTGNDLDKLTLEQWQILGEALKIAGIRTLILSRNNLNNFTPEQWRALGEALKTSGIQALDLSVNSLHQLTVEQWQTLGETLKTAGIRALDLSFNHLHQLTVEQWQALGSGLKAAGIQILHLNSNDLDRLTPAQWQALGEALKDVGLQVLDLSRNSLDFLLDEVWLAFGKGLKSAGIQTLDLSWNDLYELTAKQLLVLGEALKDIGIQTLNLSWNKLYKLTVEQWQTLGEILRIAGIKTLDLRDNNLDKLTSAQRQAFYQMLRTSGILQVRLERDTSLDDEYWTIMLQNNCEAAFNTLEQTQRQLEDLPYLLAEQNFAWPSPLTDERLSALVKRLESSKSSVDTLIAGLLVLGYCNNASPREDEAYWEKRLHDGISLLLQASNQKLPSYLERQVNHLLWHLKATQTEHFPSVAKRLGQLWLKPPANTYHYFSDSSNYPTLSLNWQQEHRLTPAADILQKPLHQDVDHRVLAGVFI